MSSSRVSAEVLRCAAFTDDPRGGNPGGIVVEAKGLSEERMLQIARSVGYSETAFLATRSETVSEFDVRYFSPEVEVPFGGHATIAAAVALAGPEELDPLLPPRIAQAGARHLILAAVPGGA